MANLIEFDHFVEAQVDVYEQVVSELASGKKRSHWMWFIFPQLKMLGGSFTSQRYGLNSIDEAVRYLKHPILGPRLRECTQLVLAVHDCSAEEIFGYPDFLKFRSCMTLFALAASEEGLFEQALLKYYSAEKDPLTLKLLERA